MRVPPLETDRLLIREFVLADLEAVRPLLDGGESGGAGVEDDARWLQWTVLGYRELERLHQPPYGDRAIVAKETGGLVGVCGYVPLLAPFGQIPGLTTPDDGDAPVRNTPEVGLYWAVLPQQRRRGYATEAARALVEYAFSALGLRRILATTTYDNAASVAVMRRLGMLVERNPTQDPVWLQVVGILAHPSGERAGPGA